VAPANAVSRWSGLVRNAQQNLSMVSSGDTWAGKGKGFRLGKRSSLKVKRVANSSRSVPTRAFYRVAILAFMSAIFS
jgi:hypothetical protein